jgi:(S)-2-hydroxyglutarate dehydrogenase
MHDVVVAGAGIVGLATAYSLLEQRPGVDVVVLEKEAAVMQHQSGHNSGVIHSGAYYRPGSKKAQMCREGRAELMRFCDSNGIPYRLCGKLIVATDPTELPRLRAIHERARQNGVEGSRWLEAADIRSAEPSVAGVAALELPTAGIVDYREVGRVMEERIRSMGGRIFLRRGVESATLDGESIRLETAEGPLDARFLVNCAGLQSDRLARNSGLSPAVQIVPFRGEYFWLRSDRAPKIGRLIYPVPDPALPFLGVHLTLTMDGRVEAGPNAVLAFAREGYRRDNVDLRDLTETIGFPGFWAMARHNWRTGLYENYRSMDRRQFARDLARLVPGIDIDSLGGTGAGVRAQAVARDGRLVDDFVIERTRNSAHVLNAPSPAATSSFAIGAEIAGGVPRRAH